MTDTLKLDYDKVKQAAEILQNLYSGNGESEMLGTIANNIKNANAGKDYAPAQFINLQELATGTGLYAAKMGNKVTQMGNYLSTAADKIKNMDENAARDAFKSAYRQEEIEFPSMLESWINTGSTLYQAYSTVDFGKDVVNAWRASSNIGKGLWAAYKAGKVAASVTPFSAGLDVVFFEVDTVQGVRAQGDTWEDFQETGDVADFAGETVGNFGASAVDATSMLGTGLLFTPAAPLGVGLIVATSAIDVLDFGVSSFGLFGQDENGNNKSLYDGVGEGVTAALDWASNTFNWGW